MLHIIWFQSEKAIYCKIISILEKEKIMGTLKIQSLPEAEV